MYPTGASWNESFYSNLELDALLDTVAGQGELADQIETFGRIQCIVIDEVPRIVPVFRPVLLGVTEDVRDLVPMPDFTLQLRETWLDHRAYPKGSDELILGERSGKTPRHRRETCRSALNPPGQSSQAHR